MKFVKGISLFFIIPALIFLIGFYMGGRFRTYFYPGGPQTVQPEVKKEEPVKENFRRAAALEEQRIHADTRFLVEEADLRHDTTVETEWELPIKYIGMNREEFLKAMDEYALSPPLSELERGFVSLEVKSFSGKRVCVRMNYVYTAPTTSFYLMAEDHHVIVYCDDRKTVYMKTNILLDDLSDELQQKIIKNFYIEDEKTLYDFLESYSS